jgi:serine/threonine-protein kinase
LREETLGEYEILGELGRGGMATVYLAHDISLDRKVAIKVMSPALMDEGLAERFRREARTAASLNHPHVIPIYAVRERAPLLYFVMKFIPGQSLDPIMKSQGQLPIMMARVILSQAAGALGYAHRRGVIHRDVKPANIMLDEEGWVVMTDFGIAKVSTATGLTMTGVTVGTPAYMSPEQCLGKEVTGASDQYSLGVVAYEMLTGRKPFTAGTAMAMMYAHFNEDPKPIRELRPDIPADLEAAVMRMLSKDPDQRWPRIDDVFGTQSLAHDDPTRQQLVTLALTSPNATMVAQLSTPTSPIPQGRRTVTRPTTAGAAPTEAMAQAGRTGAVSPPPADATRAAPRETAAARARRTATGTAAAADRPAAAAARPRWLPWAGAGAVGVALMTLLLAWPPKKPAAVQESPADSALVDTARSRTDSVRTESVAGKPGDSVRVAGEGAGGETGPPPGPPAVVAVARIQIQPARLALEAGQSAPLALQLWAADGTPIRDRRDAEWTSSAQNVAAVGRDGSVRAGRPGRATITAVVEGKKATAAIEVRAAAEAVTPRAQVASASITPPGATLAVGRGMALDLVLKDARGNQLADRPAAWSSSSPAVTVSSTGQVQAVAPGTAVVTATVDGRTASATITVPQVPVANVRLSAPPGPLKPGETVQLTATALDAAGAALDDRRITWSSSEPAVASVADGRVMARGPGTAEIAGTVEGKRGAVTVTVAAPPPVTPTVDAGFVAQELNRQLDAFVDALNRRSMELLRRAYPGLTPTEEARWRGMLEEKRLTKLEANRERTQAPRIEENAAEVRFTLRLKLQSAGAPANEFTTDYRAAFEPDAGKWQLRRLIQLQQ